ncbi:MAG TPA: FISUMP domain-containing protein [Bacteroidales bacterium]|nr:FISUMP domain-containing protein [Bacteroidales bacterium]HPS51067.1 FISUMP domain-containing protein [Bacteroidales bacterium]
MGNTHNFCFPQFVQRYKAYIHQIGTCQNTSIKFTTDIWPPADSIRWNFGDPASGAANLSVIANPSHVYSAAGTYTVELYVRHNDNRTDTTWKNITIQEAPTPTLGPDQNICTGQTATFDAGACAGCTYEWKNITSGLVIGTNQTYTTGTPGVYGVIVTGPNGCSGRDTVQLSIAPTAVMSVTVAGTPGTICSGAAALFTATAVNGGTSPAYQWKVNGINIPGATNATCSYTPANGDQIACEVTSSDPCVGNSPATSPPVSITVYPLPTVAAVADPSTSICSGNSVTLTGSGAAGYVWSNGVANGIPFVPASTATYTVTGSDAFGCSNTAQIVVTVNPLPNVIANASSSSVCAGSPVILTGSGAVTYVWNNGVMNGIPIIPLASQTYTVTGTDENGCSNTAQITVVVVPAVAVGLSINASANPLCTGSPVTFTATPVNGGSLPAYQWKVNGVNASGATNSGYSYLPVNGDVVTCSLNASASCVTGNPAISNAITMIVNNNLPAGVSIVASANPFCPGSSVTFTATPVNGGSSPAFQWKVNGINAAGGNASAYTYSPANSDVVTCVMNSNLTCVTANPATSPSITLTVRDAPNVIFSRCFDTVTFVNAQPFRLTGGLPIGGVYTGQGVNSSSGIFTPSVAGTGIKTITYAYSNFYSCMASKTATILVKPSPVFTCGSTFTDPRDNKTYSSALFGSQCWMAVNLDHGTTISEFTAQTDNCIPEKYIRNASFAYSSCYQWDELMRYETAPSAQGLCPPGWHIPASAEWSALISYLGGAATAGSAMKDPFAAGGFHSEQTGFLYLNYRWAFFDDIYAGAMYWTSTPSGSDRAVARGLNETNHSVSLYPAARANAFGVRCVKDVN